MRELIISDLKGVTRKMIKALETWLENVKSGEWQGDEKCPFCGTGGMCNLLFENLSRICCKRCPCSVYGQAETVLAFSIICDVWKAYHAKP